MARASFYFASRGASLHDRVGALEDIVESVASTDAGATRETLPHSVHFGGGSVYPTSSDFPLWFRGPDASPFATTLTHYNQFPANVEAVAGGQPGVSELIYVTGTSAANQLQLPMLAWDKNFQTSQQLGTPYRAYLDNVDVELSLGVQWTPDAVAQKRPWQLRMLLISDNEPYIEDNAVNETPVRVYTGQYTPRDLFAAQPGVAVGTVFGCSGRQVRWPMTNFSMCDRVVRSPLRRSMRGDAPLAATIGFGHARQYGAQRQLQGLVDGGPDDPSLQAFSTVSTDAGTGSAVPGSYAFSIQTLPVYQDFPENSPGEFIARPSTRNFSVYHDVTLTLQPPTFEELQAAGTGTYTTTTQTKLMDPPNVEPGSYVYQTFTGVAGGLPDTNQSSLDYFGDNRHLQRRYVVNLKLPVRALQSWSITSQGDRSIRILNRTFKLVFVHSPTRYWGTVDVDPQGSGATIVDTWPISVVAAGNSDLSRRLRESVQCPSVRLNVGCVLHFNRKVDSFTEEYREGLAVKDASAANDAVPGETHMATARWMAGRVHDHQTADLARSAKRERVG